MIGKKTSPDVAIIGMGRTGCSVARFFDARGVAYVTFDEKLKSLPEDIHGSLRCGALQAKELKKFARIIVSPGIAWHHPVLLAARESGVQMFGDLDLFREHYVGDLLAVTGTNGKSTVVHLMGQMLEILPGGVEIGGNIGIPMLDMLNKDPVSPRAVLELSSFQLERCHGVRPRWAVLLNVQPDHADMHVDMQAYEAAKLRIFTEQGEGDTAMLPVDDCWDILATNLQQRGVRVCRFGHVQNVMQADTGLLGDTDQRRIFWTAADGTHEVAIDQIMVRGEHQHLNLAVAAQVAADFGISPTVIRELLTAFKGLDHRLRYVGQHAGKSWYNDSKATNPDAALAALNSFDQVIWICGGLTKGVDVMPMLAAVRAHVAQAFVIGKDPQAFVALLEEAGVDYQLMSDLDNAVAQAAKSNLSLPVLLSPAAASMDQFPDYAARGFCFSAAVAALKKAA
ncbi:MAG: UDP-N-acetylmuramoyl-L-alanine--D-glutamate ligase [Mariprofundaceae bacterium]|nr:UDP-N-acetylmuramoyl-L-alanine--D-glutamate ligase [Mariprofundaceae bacterium]